MYPRNGGRIRSEPKPRCTDLAGESLRSSNSSIDSSTLQPTHEPSSATPIPLCTASEALLITMLAAKSGAQAVRGAVAARNAALNTTKVRQHPGSSCEPFQASSRHQAGLSVPLLAEYSCCSCADLCTALNLQLRRCRRSSVVQDRRHGLRSLRADRRLHRLVLLSVRPISLCYDSTRRRVRCIHVFMTRKCTTDPPSAASTLQSTLGNTNGS